MKKRLLILFVGLFAFAVIGLAYSQIEFSASMGGTPSEGGVYGKCGSASGKGCTAGCPHCGEAYYSTRGSGKGELTRGICINCKKDISQGGLPDGGEPDPGHGN